MGIAEGHLWDHSLGNEAGGSASLHCGAWLMGGSTIHKLYLCKALHKYIILLVFNSSVIKK